MSYECIYHECENNKCKHFQVIKFEGLYEDKYLLNIDGMLGFTIDYCPFCGEKLL